MAVPAFSAKLRPRSPLNILRREEELPVEGRSEIECQVALLHASLGMAVDELHLMNDKLSEAAETAGREDSRIPKIARCVRHCCQFMEFLHATPPLDEDTRKRWK